MPTSVYVSVCMQETDVELDRERGGGTEKEAGGERTLSLLLGWGYLGKADLSCMSAHWCNMWDNGETEMGTAWGTEGRLHMGLCLLG